MLARNPWFFRGGEHYSVYCWKTRHFVLYGVVLLGAIEVSVMMVTSFEGFSTNQSLVVFVFSVCILLGIAVALGVLVKVKSPLFVTEKDNRIHTTVLLLPVILVLVAPTVFYLAL